MEEPVWHTGPLAQLPGAAPGPVVWLVRLDDPATQDLARQAPLRPHDLRDLANRPQAAMRALRRQMAKLLIARLAAVHPDAVTLDRSPLGAPVLTAPEGWHISVAGRWPHALIGVAHEPLGVDIEPEGAAPPPDDALTPGERLAFTRDEERLRCWTAKEAHAKALGVASQIDPAAIHAQRQGSNLHASSREGQTLCRSARLEGMICTVALQTFGRR